MKNSIRFVFKSFHPHYLQPLIHLLENSLSKKPWNSIFQKSNFYYLPKQSKIFTVLRSPHVDKKSREQFELNISKQGIVFNSFNFDNSFNTSRWFNLLSSFLKFKTPAGVGLTEVRQIKVLYKNTSK